MKIRLLTTKGLMMLKHYNPFLDILPSIDVHGFNRDMIRYILNDFINDNSSTWKR